MASLLNKLSLRQLNKVLKKVNSYSDKMKEMSDETLKHQTVLFKGAI